MLSVTGREELLCNVSDGFGNISGDVYQNQLLAVRERTLPGSDVKISTTRWR